MISFLRQRRAIQRESERLVAMVHTGIPLGTEHRVTAGRLTNKSAATVRRVVTSASTFADEHQAGMLSRAYLTNRVRWGLKDSGYADDFVESITASILVAMESVGE